MSTNIMSNSSDIRSNLFLLSILLEDKATDGNIKWATNLYDSLGEDFSASREILPSDIIGQFGDFVRARVTKDERAQILRTKGKAEVFTPSWSCNRQNNLVDEAWFGRKNVFNMERDHGWATTLEKVSMPDGKIWKDYVLVNRMEMSCGEAPYITSRYDVTTGTPIPVKDRIGMLDRKLRIVNENTSNPRTWFSWTKKAYKHIYGFDLQGDSVFLARENLLLTFIDNMQYKFGKLPTRRQIYDIARIIVWNIWQMDGLNYSAPYSNTIVAEQLDLFEVNDSKEIKEAAVTPVPSIIYDWDAHKTVVFRDLVKGE